MASVSPMYFELDKIDINPVRERIGKVITDLIASLPSSQQLNPSERRGIIARYSAVLEGNFIYWMTGAYLAVESEKARSLILENLSEEIRDCHPGMLRRFCLAANAAPSDADALAIHPYLANVRLFIGRLSPVPIVAMMAFFEGFIQQFMAYLAELARLQGSEEMEYADVHGVCDVAHSQELFVALKQELALAADSDLREEDIFEGIHLLKTLIQHILSSQATSAA